MGAEHVAAVVGTFSHLWPSKAHESAVSTPSTRWRWSAGHGPRPEGAVDVHPGLVLVGDAVPAARSSTAPVFTLPAWRRRSSGRLPGRQHPPEFVHVDLPRPAATGSTASTPSPAAAGPGRRWRSARGRHHAHGRAAGQARRSTSHPARASTWCWAAARATCWPPGPRSRTRTRRPPAGPAGPSATRRPRPHHGRRREVARSDTACPTPRPACRPRWLRPAPADREPEVPRPGGPTGPAPPPPPVRPRPPPQARPAGAPPVRPQFVRPTPAGTPPAQPPPRVGRGPRRRIHQQLVQEVTPNS